MLHGNKDVKCRTFPLGGSGPDRVRFLQTDNLVPNRKKMDKPSFGPQESKEDSNKKKVLQSQGTSIS